MLLPREKRMVKLLYKEKKEMTTNELAKSLHISSRTVKEDIKRIRFELEGTSCQIESKTGRGIWLSYDDQGREFLDKLFFHEESASALLPETRKYYVALSLLDEEDYISMEQISETLFVSKGTIMNDVNRLQAFFEEFDLSLERKVKHGIRLLGTESKKRIAKANVIHKIVGYHGNDVIKKLEPFFEDLDLNIISNIILSAEAKYSFVLADTSFLDLVTNLSIVIIRVMNKKHCDLNELGIIDDSEKRNIAMFIIDSIQNEFEILLTEGDINYILMILIGSKLQKTNNLLEVSQQAIRAIDADFYDALLLMMEEIDYLYGEELVKDDLFKTTLFIHLNALLSRVLNSIYLENPLKNDIKKNLGYEFEIATYLAGLLKNELELEIQEDEICDIALYIGASFRRKNQYDKSRPKVTIICGTGMSTSLYIEAKLKQIFPFVEIVDTLPISNVKSLKKNRQDLVITTVPLKLDTMDVLHISPMLNDEDIEHIKSYLTPEISTKKFSNSQYGFLLSQFHKSISIFHQDCLSKEEVIRMLGSRLIHEGYVDEGFIKSVFKREELAPTSIGGGIAIPHSFKGHVKKSGIGFMTLKKPIQWDDEKVQIILMISLDPESKESFREIFTELANITEDYSLIEQILEVTSYKDLIKVLTNKR